MARNKEKVRRFLHQGQPSKSFKIVQNTASEAKETANLRRLWKYNVYLVLFGAHT